jgi:hypothetical protein
LPQAQNISEFLHEILIDDDLNIAFASFNPRRWSRRAAPLILEGEENLMCINPIYINPQNKVL